jgi:hypothetical protein
MNMSAAEQVEQDPIAADTVPPTPVVVAEVDRLRAEVLSLKHMNVSNRETILQQQIVQLSQQIKDVQLEKNQLNIQLMTLRRDLEAKYGIDLTTQVVMPDGSVRPRGGMPSNMAQLKQNLGE